MSRATLTAIIVTLLVSAGTAHAKLTTGACLAQKRVAWGALRKCQATEDAKQLKGKLADLPKCDTKLQDALAKIGAKATKAAIACRYGDNGDGTVIDYDSGLQWEKKGLGSGLNGACKSLDVHCVNSTYSWDDAVAYVNGTSGDGSTINGVFAGFAGHSDWRLPTVVELAEIVDVSAAGCSSKTGPCIDAIFGPTVASLYWSATTDPSAPLGDEAWFVVFGNGLLGPGDFTGFDPKVDPGYVRAVRAAL